MAERIAGWLRGWGAPDWLDSSWVLGVLSASLFAFAVVLVLSVITLLVRLVRGDALSPKRLAAEALETFVVAFSEGPVKAAKTAVRLGAQPTGAESSLENAFDEAWRKTAVEAVAETLSHVPRGERRARAKALEHALQVAALNAGDIAKAGGDEAACVARLIDKLRERDPGFDVEAVRALLKTIIARVLVRPDVAQALDRASLSRLLQDTAALRMQVDSVEVKVTRLLPQVRAAEGYALLHPRRIANLPTMLLVADYGVTPYDDSRGLLGALGDGSSETVLGWASSPTDIAARLYVAAGGQGKTRLALEAISKLNTPNSGWRAGLLSRQGLDEALQQGPRGEASAFEQTLAERGQTGLFFAIDYAETRIEQMQKLAQALGKAGSGGPIRLMLLARTDGWWPGFIDKLEAAREKAIFEPQASESIAGEIGEGHRQAFFADACIAFAEKLETAAPDLIAADWRARAATPEIIAASGSPLFLAFQAFLHVRGQQLTHDPLAVMAGEERRHHGRALGEQNQNAADAMAKTTALVTLCQGLTAQQVEAGALRTLARLAAKASSVLANLDADEAADIRTLAMEKLTALYGDDGFISPVLPDLLGERLAGETLRDAPSLLPALLDAQSEDAFSIFTVLNRISKRRGEHYVHEAALVERVRAALRDVLPARLAPQALPFVAAAQAEVGAIQDDARAVLDALAADAKTHTARALIAAAGRIVNVNATPVRLRQLLGEAASAAAHGAAPEAAQEESQEALAQRAQMANERGVFLGNAGRREEALAASQEAVALRRALAAQNPDAFNPALAMALNNLSSDLSALGLREEALAASEEAVSIYRVLAAQNPDAFNPDLAGALNNLSNCLSALGRREEALAASQEAVALRRTLATQNPDAFNPALASALNNLSNRLSDLGRREEALAASQDALALYRALAAQNPDAFNPDLAMALNNLSNRLSDLGRREEALAASQDAVALRRTLAAQNPDAFNPDLASALNNLSNRLSGLGRREEALAANEESVALTRTLAAQNPDAFNPALATALNNLSNRLSGLGRREEALAASQEAVALRRTLATQNPDAFNPALASALNNLSNRLSDLGRREEALAASQDALALYRALAAQNPDAFNPDLASALNNLSNSLSELGRREEALAVSEEAVALTRTLAAQNPDAFNPALASALNNLSSDLSDLGRREEALAASQDAVALRRTLAAQNPDAFNPALASALNNLSIRLSGLGRREEALAASEEAVSIYRVLAAQNPDAFNPALARALGSQGQILAAVGRNAEAEASFLEAVSLIAPMAAAAPQAFGSLASALARDFIKAAQSNGKSEAQIIERLKAAGMEIKTE